MLPNFMLQSRKKISAVVFVAHGQLGLSIPHRFWRYDFVSKQHLQMSPQILG